MKQSLRYVLVVCLLFIVESALLAQSRIQNLNATQYKNNIQISCVLGMGSPCSGYKIERSSDSYHFETIYDYAGVCGSNEKELSISYTDQNPIKNSTNYYRVVIPPSDYSAIVASDYIEFPENGYFLLQNPVTDTFTLYTNLQESGNIIIYNQQGHKVLEFKKTQEGMFKEDVSDLPVGLYYFTVENKKIRGKFLKN